jgi:hypothetical protein
MNFLRISHENIKKSFLDRLRMGLIPEVLRISPNFFVNRGVSVEVTKTDAGYTFSTSCY